jgi:hypothetical protein
MKIAHFYSSLEWCAVAMDGICWQWTHVCYKVIIYCTALWTIHSTRKGTFLQSIKTILHSPNSQGTRPALCVDMLNYACYECYLMFEFVRSTKYKRDEMLVYRNYIYIYTSFIWLHVSTRNESSSGHFNLLIWQKLIINEMLAGYGLPYGCTIYKMTHCELKHVAIWNLLYIYIYIYI